MTDLASSLSRLPDLQTALRGPCSTRSLLTKFFDLLCALGSKTHAAMLVPQFNYASSNAESLRRAHSVARCGRAFFATQSYKAAHNRYHVIRCGQWRYCQRCRSERTAKIRRAITDGSYSLIKETQGSMLFLIHGSEPDINSASKSLRTLGVTFAKFPQYSSTSSMFFVCDFSSLPASIQSSLSNAVPVNIKANDIDWASICDTPEGRRPSGVSDFRRHCQPPPSTSETVSIFIPETYMTLPPNKARPYLDHTDSAFAYLEDEPLIFPDLESFRTGVQKVYNDFANHLRSQLDADSIQYRAGGRFHDLPVDSLSFAKLSCSPCEQQQLDSIPLSNIESIPQPELIGRSPP